VVGATAKTYSLAGLAGSGIAALRPEVFHIRSDQFQHVRAVGAHCCFLLPSSRPFTAYPVLLWLTSAPTFLRHLAVELWFSFLFGLYAGAMVVFLTEIMPGLQDHRILFRLQPRDSCFRTLSASKLKM
jgi:hypothetical protein